MATKKKKAKRAKPAIEDNETGIDNNEVDNGETEVDSSDADDRREYIATVALGGLLANTSYAVVGRAAKRALDEADALIKLLDANNE